MALGPIDYGVNVVNPLASAAQGLSLGAGLRNVQAQQEQQALQMQQARQAAAEEEERKINYQRAIQGLYNSENPTFDDYMRAFQFGDKQQREFISARFSGMKKEEQESSLRFGAQVLASSFVDPNKSAEMLTQRAELEAERGNAEQADAYRAAAEGIKVDPRSAQISIASMIAQLPNGEAVLKATLPTAGVGPSVQKSEILTDGTVVKVMKDGSVVVEDKEGQVVTGKERTRAIVEARQKEIEQTGAKRRAALESELALRRKLEFEREQGKSTSDELEKINTGIESAQGEISLLKDALAEVQAGAGMGVLESRLPSFRAATIKLHNIKNQLGLQVISAATFGALSEGELRLAMDTAMPPLDEKDLGKWLSDRIAAKEKMINYMLEASAFLESGGSRAEWIRLQRGQKEQSDAGTQVKSSAPTLKPGGEPAKTTNSTKANDIAKSLLSKYK